MNKDNGLQDQFLAKSKMKSFVVGQYRVISQDPSAVKTDDREQSARLYLPQFLLFWHDLEQATGYRWKNTSYLRNSPSHRVGHAFDLAPDLDPQSEQYYAVYNNSDPVLYKRNTLVQILQTLRNNDYSVDGSNKLGVFIEPDHLHVQVIAADGGGDYPTNVIKWQVPKPIYPDTYSRMALPVMD
jgi:hypothetical protein